MNDEKDSGKDRGVWPVRDLPSSWVWASFDDAFSNETTSEQKLAQRSYQNDGTLAVIDQGQSAIAGYTSDATLRHPSPLPVVVFGDHTRCVKFVDFPFVQGADGVKVLRPRDGVDARFAFHALRAVALPDRGYARHYKFLAATAFPIPPRNEQLRIVAKLDSLQACSRRAREALDTVPPLLEKLRQSILATAFRGDLTKDWRAKHPDVEPASELLKRSRAGRRRKWEETELAKMNAKGKSPRDDRWKARYKEPEPIDATGLPQLPKGWAWATLDELTERITKGSSPNWQGFEYVPQGIPFVRSQNVSWGTLDLSDVANLPPAFNAKEPRSILRTGDVLLNIVGASIGRAAVATEAIDGGNTNQAVAVIRLLNSGLGFFVVQWLLSPPAQRRMNLEKVDVARANLSLDDVAHLPVPLPPLAEVAAIGRAIGTAVEHLRALAACANRVFSCSDDLERSVLAKAFHGELVPQDPNDEPAAAMLERMRATNGSMMNGKHQTAPRRARGAAVGPEDAT